MAAGRSRHRSQQDHSCCGIVEELELRREQKARSGKPQPWVIRKLSIGIAIAFLCYAYYVYIGRLCVPMILQNTSAMGGRPMGVAFLIVFCLLGFMVWWSYAKVVFTPPGYACDHVRKTKPPAPPEPQTYAHFDTDGAIGGSREGSSTAHDPPSDAAPSPVHESRHNGDLSEKHHAQHSGRSNQPRHERTTSHTHDTNAGMLDALPGTAQGTMNVDTSETIPGVSNIPTQSQRHRRQESDLPSPKYTRRPPMHPTLAPEYRYCRRDNFVKPMRTHHCRSCGTCVLQYDHHCPWIGQCVGAFNHKFFVHFVQWAFVFCVWVFSTLLALNINASQGADPQEIAVIAIAGFFTLFTLALLLSHIRLIILNQTTVESLQLRSMTERENEMLRHMFSFFQIREKRATKKRWDEEWGRLHTEGNIWWLGSALANWEATMGTSKWGWFLPIGRTPGDGLTYPINPRFDHEGRWRRRAEWPAELR